ncbi:polymer-forming cytoskeletal protein [bacterium]|nr:polymer-forming cytoskeletal protein [bacterium]
MKADRNIAAVMLILTIALLAGLVSSAAADGVALGDGAVNVIDETNTPASGTRITIANTMRFAQTERFEVLEGEVYPYDLYLWTGRMNIQGTLDGDVFVGGQHVTVDGTVTQDMAVMAENLVITGVVEDDVRAMGRHMRISGRVDGDVLAAGETVTIEEGAVINGSLLVGAGTVYLHGHVKGSARVGAGTIVMGGRIDGNAELLSDGGLTIIEPAFVGGDLVYQGPTQLEFDEGTVGGSVTFRPPHESAAKKVSSADFSFGPAFSAAMHIFGFFAAIIAGTIIIALTKNHAQRTANKIRTRALKSLGIGFVAYICIPIVVLITLVLIITIPLSVVLALAYLIAVYIAKFYFAIWLGNCILRRGDRILTESPIPPMLLGLVIVYLLTAIPVLGTLIGILIIFFGLGALLQRKETRLESAFEPTAPTVENGLPSVFPGSTEG